MVRPAIWAAIAALLGGTLALGRAPAQDAPARGPVNPDPEMRRPIEARDSLFLEELTWLEVRDALRSGKRTAIVASGGVEQNGPYLVTGKHNVVLRAATEAIARKLGTALVAPIVPFVPEGEIEPPSGHMRYPGTISVSQETFRRLLTEIAASLRAHGFERIVLLADSGGNVDGMKQVAAELTARWEGGRCRVRYVPEYYDFYDAAGLAKRLEGLGIREKDEGHHDNFAITAMMLTVDPDSIRMRERVKAGRFSINGVSLAPRERTALLGRRLLDERARETVEGIRKAFGGR